MTAADLDALITKHPSWHAIQIACLDVFIPAINQLPTKIDYIVGLSRGGLIPAVILSHQLDIPLFPVKYSSKSGNGDNKNHDNELPSPPVDYVSGSHDPIAPPTLLIVDDISDSGNTLREVVDYYQKENHTVYSAALYYKALPHPVIIPDIVWKVIEEAGPWITFPWETIPTDH